MKFKFKKSLLKIFGISVITLGVALPLASCSYYKSWNKNDSVDNNNNDNNGSNTNNTYIGSIDTSIANSKIVSANDQTLTEKNANDYGLTQNVNDFASNGDFSQISGNQSKLQDDIIGLLNILYFSNNKQISITNSKVENLKVDNSTNTKTDGNSSGDLKLNSSKISFDLSATISTGNSMVNLNLPWGQTTLVANSSQVLKISVNNQVMLPTINEMNGKFYLGWKVASATINFQNKTVNVSNLNFTYGSFSKVFYITYNNLSDVDSYFDLQKKYSSDLSKSLTVDNFKKMFESSVDSQQEDYFFYADMTTSIVKMIGDNIPIDQMLKTASKFLIQILTHMSIIPSGFEEILIEALFGDSKDGSTIVSEPFINVLDKNRDKINDVLKTYLGSAYDVIEPIIGDIKPNMTTTDKGFLSVKNYVDMLLANISDANQKKDIENMIYGDVLGVSGYGTAKNLWDIIITRYQTIINIIKSNVTGVDTSLLDNILNLLNIIFKTSSDGKYQSVIDAIFSTSDTKKTFLDALTQFIPGIKNIREYLDILITNDESFNNTNILKLVNSFSSFLQDMFVYKTGASSETKYTDRYANLSFKSNWGDVSLDSNNTEATYSYSLSFSITKKLTLNLQPIKDLISKDSFNNLLNKIINDLIKINLGSLLSSSLSNLQGDLFNFIPNSISFGDDGGLKNSLTYSYSGSKEKLWFNPMKLNNDYYNGFSVGYDMNVFYEDSGMWNSIVSNYESKDFNRNILILGSYTLKYYDFWKSILENIIMRSYNVSGRFNFSDYSEKIATSESYNPNYYYTNLVFTNNNKNVNVSDLNTWFSTDKSENYKPIENQVSWKNSNSSDANNKIIGKSLITTDTNKNNALSKMYSISTDLKNSDFNNLNYGYDFEFNPILNCVIPLEFMLKVNLASVDIDYKIDLSISAYTSTIYFPVNFYDTTNKKLVSSVNKNYYYFNANAQQVNK